MKRALEAGLSVNDLYELTKIDRWFLSQMQELEKGDGQWTADKTELSSAVKFIGGDGKLATSRLQPDRVAQLLSDFLSSRLQASATRV